MSFTRQPKSASTKGSYSVSIFKIYFTKEGHMDNQDAKLIQERSGSQGLHNWTDKWDRWCIQSILSSYFISRTSPMMPDCVESTLKTAGSLVIFQGTQNRSFHFSLVILGFHKEIDSVKNLIGVGRIGCIDKRFQSVPKVIVQRVEVWTICTLNND